MNIHTKKTIENAYNTARKTLQDRYADVGILAGKHHFSDLWLRDSCYAALGALSIGDTQVVRRSLETMLKHQHISGQIPLRVGQKWFILKYLGFDGKVPQARFKDDKEVSIPTDSNSLFLITLENYFQKTQDKAFVIQYWDKIKQALLWNFSQDHNHDLLIEEGHYAGWADSLKKSGTVLYTNVLHIKALQSYVSLCKLIGNKSDAEHFEYLFTCATHTFYQKFWNGSYFIDWIDASEVAHTHFSTEGNVLAIIYKIANLDQAKKIQNYIKLHKMDQGFSTDSVYPAYENKDIYTVFNIIKLNDYHNGLQWLWIGCADAVSKSMAGMHSEAVALLTRIAEKIVEYGGVYEVYDEGVPLKRIMYKSEQWFAWSAGLFVWACHELNVLH